MTTRTASLVPIILLIYTLILVSTNGGRANDRRSQSHKQRSANNTLSYLYIAGVEGVGHHGVTPAIATIAITCNKQILYEIRKLRLHQQKRSSEGFNSALEQLRKTPFLNNDVVIIDDVSFPSGKNYRGPQDQKVDGQYDLAWAHNELLQTSIKVKFLYLTRDFYRTVSSHPEFDGGFKPHAQVLHSFMRHIQSEYHKIDLKQPNVWTQISYEWFTNMDIYNCTAIVSAIIDFMEWDNCDVEFACKILHETVHKEKPKVIDPSDFAYAQTFNVTPSIPVLDISPNRTYNFTTRVSKRVPFNIVADLAAHEMERAALHSRPERAKGGKLQEANQFTRTTKAALQPGQRKRTHSRAIT